MIREQGGRRRSPASFVQKTASFSMIISSSALIPATILAAGIKIAHHLHDMLPL